MRLLALIDEAKQRARALVIEKNPALPPAEVDAVARAVGVGAVKYADLSKNRTSDYTFDWNAMLAFDGNTAPYLQYAYARIQSLFAKAPGGASGESSAAMVIATAEEHALALLLARYQETLELVAATVMPHHLCNYLYDLAASFMRFYENCPVHGSDAAESRLALCRKTAETLSGGLGLLGIETVDRM